MLVKPALVASGLCVQVCNCASVYTEVSRRFVMPVISTISGNLALSKAEATVSQNFLLKLFYTENRTLSVE